jgi:hypothetical protein
MSIVYDLGPRPPVRPVKSKVLLETPELPPGATGPTGYEPEQTRYNEKYRNYLHQLELYPAERAAWVAKHGDAVELRLNEADEILGREYVANDPRRYCFKLPDGIVASNLRQMAFRALQGLPAALPLDPDAESSNVHSIEAARTRRATAHIMRSRSLVTRPL